MSENKALLMSWGCFVRAKPPTENIMQLPNILMVHCIFCRMLKPDFDQRSLNDWLIGLPKWHYHGYGIQSSPPRPLGLGFSNDGRCHSVCVCLHVLRASSSHTGLDPACYEQMVIISKTQEAQQKKGALALKCWSSQDWLQRPGWGNPLYRKPHWGSLIPAVSPILQFKQVCLWPPLSIIYSKNHSL